ncbi:hypothetical protein [Kutzneria chonburiensis]|uniref:Uncharacterized protein n=1 Tax=Kutzneria chonburiensis TaxID=1483604 RepID=A0ABV6MNQ2_9PSEU|nr:hypothetical protein [Kutzneria chonburiensis]
MIALGFFVTVRKRWREYQLITYTTVVYVLGTAASVIARVA